jgi:hypothetical protein
MIGWAFADFLIGLTVACVLISTHPGWPHWVKIVTFIGCIIAWPIPLAVVVGMWATKEK